MTIFTFVCLFGFVWLVGWFCVEFFLFVKVSIETPGNLLKMILSSEDSSPGLHHLKCCQWALQTIFSHMCSWKNSILRGAGKRQRGSRGANRSLSKPGELGGGKEEQAGIQWGEKGAGGSEVDWLVFC